MPLKKRISIFTDIYKNAHKLDVRYELELK